KALERLPHQLLATAALRAGQRGQEPKIKMPVTASSRMVPIGADGAERGGVVSVAVNVLPFLECSGDQPSASSSAIKPRMTPRPFDQKAGSAASSPNGAKSSR